VDIEGKNLDYEDLELRYALIDYQNYTIEDGYIQIKQRINSTNMQIFMPSFMSNLALRAEFRFYRAKNQKTLGFFSLLLIDTPIIDNYQLQHMFLDNLKSLVISGDHLMPELDLVCSINNTEATYQVTRVNRTHLVCPLSLNLTLEGEYRFLILARSINYLINRPYPVLLYTHVPPKVQYIDRHLITRTFPEDLRLSLYFD
jgi:hypothetical protein